MNQGSRTSVGSFVDDIPEKMWGSYGENSVALCNGHALVILPGAFQPDGFDAMRRQMDEARGEASIPPWQDLMAKCHTSVALIPVTLCNRRVVLPGNDATSPATCFFKPLESSPWKDWVPMTAPYVTFLDAWGVTFGRPQPPGENGALSPVPLVGRDKKGRFVLWGAIQPQQHYDLAQHELHNLKQMRHAA